MKQMKIAWIEYTDDSNPYFSVKDTVRRKCEQEIDSWFRKEGVTIEIIAMFLEIVWRKVRGARRIEKESNG